MTTGIAKIMSPKGCGLPAIVSPKNKVNKGPTEFSEN
jgi:hypothetical protein